MPVKERLSSVSIETLTQVKPKPIRITIQEDILSSKPFIIPKRKSVEAKFTGRQRELDYLRTLYSETIIRIKKQTSSGEVQYKPMVAAIKGEAGIGKSRLVKEFLFRVSSATGCGGFISGGSYSSGQNTYGLVSNLLKNSLGLSGKTQGNLYYSEAYPQVKAKASALSQDNIAQLTKLICGQITEQNRIAANNAVKEYLFTFCGELNKHNNPLVITLEDMQWADEPSLEAIEHILKSINLFTEAKQPQVLFILNYRSGFKPSKTLRAESDYREIILEGFNEKETEQLVFSLAGNKTLNAKTKEEIFKRSDGNPFNIEEWFSMFAEGKNRKVIPETVRSLLAEKVSSLEAGEKAALIAASVLGRKFELKIVNEILKQAGKEQATEKTMQSLIEKRYLVNLTGDIYEFRHDILQETIYRYLNINTRRNAHLLAGIAIEALYPNRLNDYYYELARHYTEAKSESKSLEYLERAGDKAKNNYEHERAIRYYKKLLQKITGRKRYDITFKLCDVYMNRSEWNKQIELCKNILAESLRLDKNIKAECYKRIGHTYRLKGDYKDALKVYKKTYRIYEEKHDAQGKLDIMEREAKVMMNMGKYKEALAGFEMIYKISKEKKYNELYKNALIGLGIVCSKMGKYKEALSYNEELLFYAKSYRNISLKMKAIINVSEVFFLMKDYNKAHYLYIQAMKLAKQLNNMHELALCVGNIATIYYSQNKYSKTINLLNRQLKLFLFIGDSPGVSRVYGLMGAVNILQKEYFSAIKYLQLQLQIGRSLERKQTIALCFGNLGIIYNLLGNFKKSKSYFLLQLKIDKKLGNLEGILRANINLGIQYYYLGRHLDSKRKFKLVLKMCKDRNIESNLSLTLLYYSEVLLCLGHISESNKIALQAKEESIKLNNSWIMVSLMILIKKTELLMFLRKTNLSCEQVEKMFLRTYGHFKILLRKSMNKCEKAMILYEIWKTGVLSSKYNVEIIDTIKYKKKSLKLYTNLYLKSPEFVFKKRIEELKK